MRERKERRNDDIPVQMAIDPETGRDITGEVIARRLKELEIVANDIIRVAVDEHEKNPSKRKEIYEESYWEIHQKLGDGSIGPATAAAGPLMYSKLDELAKLLGVNDDERLDL